MPPSYFLQMPLHLITLVLVELDCIQSLGSAILSHSSVYAAFKEYPKTVIYRILLKQIPRELRSYAIIAHNTSWGGHRSPHELRRYIRHALRCTRGLSTDEADLCLWRSLERLHFSPAVASSLSKTHMLVEHFTQRYLADTLPIAARDLFRGWEKSPTNARRPSDDEVYRVRRALYRFQIYCNLVCIEHKDKQYRNLVRPFFIRWSPWVNEQLACIHDYLEGVLSQAFDEVAAHDILWGASSVDWVSRGRNNTYKQAYLLYGLPFLYKIDHAKDYDERLGLLDSHGPVCIIQGLAADLKSIAIPPHGPMWILELEQWRTEDFVVLAREEGDGPDGLQSGPFNTWWYAHMDVIALHSVLLPENWRLRRCGYVMWDAPSSVEETEDDEISFFERRLRRIQRTGRRGLSEPEGAREEMERSWAERTGVLRRGGHGYWAHGDLSKVV
ncbi:hypothetical protein VPNG_03497 [Cytospora leucostoma]|uniref:F-box domain-containing protein n=1 Tax=Cytospora leucostoma TaxID=1230097 RepID=A0A423XCP7_9PEZI|nr:hypothetical protein VPNG_03497 [Cytospora leucostoma]